MALRPRLARFVLTNCAAADERDATALSHHTQTEVAQRLGTVREVVSRTLTDFIARGLLARTVRGLVVADREGLVAEAMFHLGPIGDAVERP